VNKPVVRLCNFLLAWASTCIALAPCTAFAGTTGLANTNLELQAEASAEGSLPNCCSNINSNPTTGVWLPGNQSLDAVSAEADNWWQMEESGDEPTWAFSSELDASASASGYADQGHLGVSAGAGASMYGQLYVPECRHLHQPV
jgi:hypothetical protein